MCDKCKKMSYYVDNGGVYGFDFGGVTDNAMMVGAAFAGYVAAQKIDGTVSYLKDNPKTSGAVWTGASLLTSVLFPQLRGNKMVQGASAGVGIYGLKRLNDGYDFLKDITGVNTNFAANYAEKMRQAQIIAANQAKSAALPPSQPMRPVQTQENALQLINYRLAA